MPVIYLALQIRAVMRWTGGFRLAALIPPAVWAMWAAVLILDLSRDPTAHNLFPFEILVGALLSLAYLAFIGLVRRIAR